ncbi:MAG: hypothetical protein ACYTKD_28125 [Planctomycetota bacterium]|jgi:hypothetical protein
MGLKDGVKAAWKGALSPLFEEFAGEVAVECLDRSAPPLDPLYDEPTGEKQYLPAVPLKARWKLERERLVLPGGQEIDVEGRVTLRTEDLDAAGIALDFACLVTVEGRKLAVAHMERGAQVGAEHLLTKVWVRER